MRINKNDLIRFLELVSLQGEVKNSQVILDISEKQIQVLTASNGNIAITYGILNGNFENIGQVGIEDIDKFKSFLYMFSGEEVDINKSSNHLEISSPVEKLNVSLVLKAPEYIINTYSKEKFDNWIKQSAGNMFTLPKLLIDKMILYVSALGTDNLYLKTEDNNLILFAEAKENNILASFPIKEKIEAFDIRVGKNLLDILRTIANDVGISVKNNNTMNIEYKTDNKILQYVLAQWKK